MGYWNLLEPLVSRPAVARIHLDALSHNLDVMRARAGGARVMAVVKADGYGHGLERVAAALAAADAFGVASLEDAERLRAAGHAHRIVLLSGFVEPQELLRLRQLGLDTVVHHSAQLEMLEAHPPGPGQGPLRVWLKLDSGMHRLGFPAVDAVQVHARLRALPGISDDIVLMTHFASSDAFADNQTAAQVAAFERATIGLPGERSLSNSAAVLGWPMAHAQWVRPGGALYGISVVPGRSGEEFGLRPAMTLASRLIAINPVRAGEAVGYGGRWRAPEDMHIGVVALGYGDGYPRAAKPGTPMLVDGVEVPLVGRVSMDLITLDLRHAPMASIGSEVVAWGQGLPVERIADRAGTIGYELVCSITRRVRFTEE
jgi:alanine racemase